jgi:Protein of unknown function (DUF3108)
MATATAKAPLAAGLALIWAPVLAPILAPILAGIAGQAHAQGFEAAYTIAAARIPVGSAALSGRVGPEDYAASMSGRTGGLLRVLTSGEGNMTVAGTVSGGKLAPLRYTSKTTADDDTLAVTMTFKDGNVDELEATEPAPGDDRVALTAEHRRQVLDPLTALLVPGMGGDTVCRRTLPIFDGRRRYDLKLAFKRIEQVKAEVGYAGPAVTCTVAFEPIAGHRRSSPLLTFLTDGRDVEMALAPIPGTAVLAPFRITATYMLGNVVMQATRFAATSTSASQPR